MSLKVNLHFHAFHQVISFVCVVSNSSINLHPTMIVYAILYVNVNISISSCLIVYDKYPISDIHLIVDVFFFFLPHTFQTTCFAFLLYLAFCYNPTYSIASGIHSSTSEVESNIDERKCDVNRVFCYNIDVRLYLIK